MQSFFSKKCNFLMFFAVFIAKATFLAQMGESVTLLSGENDPFSEIFCSGPDHRSKQGALRHHFPMVRLEVASCRPCDDLQQVSSALSNRVLLHPI
ncbi:MAG: hypothetical protein ACR2I0_04695, partial [Rhodoferax sp.]